MDLMIDQLKCPVCLEIPGNQVFQCERHHTICDECLKSLKECPQCRTPLQGHVSRNVALERLLDGLTLDCPNKTHGCNSKLKRTEIKTHLEESCTFGAKAIELCKIIGYHDCDERTNPKKVTSALNHFKEHEILISERAFVQIHHEKFQSAANANPLNQTMWTPVVLKLKRNENTHTFLVVMYLMEDTKTASWLCVLLDEVENAPKFEAKFLIQGQSTPKIPPIRWSIPSVSLDEAAPFFETPAHGIPLALLLDKYITEGSLLVDIVVTGANEAEQLGRRRPECLWTFSSPLRGKNDTPKIVFKEVTCSGCACTPVTGVLYQCLECSGRYYLCETCLKQGAHSEHLFAAVRDGKEKDAVVKYKKSKGATAGKPLSLDAATRLPEGPVFPFVTCDGCGSPVVGIRFKCLQCSHFSFCKSCMTGRSGSHQDHVFAMIQSLEQNELVKNCSRAIFDERNCNAIMASLRTSPRDSNQPCCKNCNVVTTGGLKSTYYRCLQCSNYELCRSCVDKQFHSGHIIAMMRSLQQRALVKKWEENYGLVQFYKN